MKDSGDLGKLLKQLARDPDDQKAWISLYTQLWPFVVGIVLRRARGRPDLSVQDTAQDIFIRLFRSRITLRITDPEEFRKYLWRIADNATRTTLRKERARAASSINLDLQELTISGEPWIQDEHEYDWEALKEIKDGLEPSEITLLDFLLDGRSLSEIASELGISYSNVGVRVYRLRTKVRRLLKSSKN